MFLRHAYLIDLFTIIGCEAMDHETTITQTIREFNFNRAVGPYEMNWKTKLKKGLLASLGFKESKYVATNLSFMCEVALFS